MVKICAVIPAYNEGNFISDVLKRVKMRKIDPIVINDGGDDSTSRIAKEEGAILLEHDSNMGKGAALRTGFRAALDNGYDYIITLDADNQHDPIEIPRFLEAIISSGENHIIAGNRMHSTANMPKSRVLFNGIASNIISSLTNQTIQDPLCGYRIYPRSFLESISLISTGYEIVPEILIEASKNGYKILSINIESIYGDEVSYIRPLRDGLRLLRLILRETFIKFREK